MSKTRVKVRSAVYADFTKQRMLQSADGITLPEAANQPSYVNQPIRSECAPNNAPISHLEKKLNPYELKKVTDFVAGYLIKQGKIRIADTSSGGGMPKGKRPARDYSPLSEKERFLMGRYDLMITRMSNRIRTGLECVGEMYVGRTKMTLLKFGQMLARDEHKKAAEGALTDFFISSAYEIERVERDYEIDERNKRIARR